MSRRHAVLADVIGRLGRADEPLGRRAREVAVQEGGLSSAMADWALTVTCARYTPAALAALPGPDAGRIAVVLSASVATAPIRAVAAPLAGGAEVMVRASRRQPTLAALLVHELSDAGLPVTLGPPERDVFLAGALAWGAEQVVAYGSDEAIAAIDAALPPDVAFEGHGHGFGLSWVAADAADAADGAWAEAVALDVAAYDQHGCLSPQLVAVEASSAAPFAERLHRALASLGERLPRGPLDGASAARILQWQGATAAVAARFWRGAHHAVAAVEPGRWCGSPGWRNVAVLPVREPGELMALLGDRARFVTTVGRAGRARPAEDLARAFGPARITPAGTMQDPPLDGPEDPRPPLRRGWAVKKSLP